MLNKNKFYQSIESMTACEMKSANPNFRKPMSLFLPFLNGNSVIKIFDNQK